jgi:hypothetical protein
MSGPADDLLALLLSDAGDVVDEQRLLMFFLLEEHLQSIANIQDTKRPRVSAEHWYF